MERGTVNDLHLVLVTVGGLVLLLGVCSSFLKARTFLTAPLISLLVGVALGPSALGVLDVARWGAPDAILEEVARLSLAIGLMAVALRLPPRYIVEQPTALAVVLGLVMPAMWLSTALLVFLVLGLPWPVALVVGAVVTPTDPIVATSIVTGPLAERRLPDRVRHLISAESGLNDGLAYPLVMLSLLLLTESPATVLPGWLGYEVLWKVGGGAAFGALVGYAAGRLLQFSERRRLIETTSFLAYTVALSLLVLGAASLIDTEGILAVFISGLTFDMAVGARERAQEEGVQEAVNQFFTLPIFALLGLVLPWSGWADLGWRAPVLVGAVLLLRRVPAVLAVRPLVAALRHRLDAVFVGWFGPLGVSALLFAVLATRATGREDVWIVSTLLMTASIVAHGVTATPLSRLYPDPGDKPAGAGRRSGRRAR